MLLGKAKGVDGPKGMGTYLWVEVENIKRLEAKGLIRRTVSPDDNRKSIIAVTEQGRCLMEALRSNTVRTEALLLNGMSESERQELRRLLHLASDNLNAFRRNGGRCSP